MLSVIQRGEAELKAAVERCSKLKVKQPEWMDRLTNFVYWDPCKSLSGLLDEAERQLKHHPKKELLTEYAISRWFNFRSSRAVEWMLCQYPGVEPHPDKRHKTIDLYIQDTPFDVKLTCLPQGMTAGTPKRDLLNWYYTNQSEGHRWGYNNRLYVVVADWKDKSGLVNISRVIEEYVLEYSFAQLIASPKHEGLVADVILVA